MLARPRVGPDRRRLPAARPDARPGGRGPHARSGGRDHQLVQHRRLGPHRGRGQRRRGRPAAHLARAAGQRRLPRPRLRPAAVPADGAGVRRGPLHLRLGPRLPARLPPAPPPARRAAGVDAGAGHHRHRQPAGHRRRRRRSSAPTRSCCAPRSIARRCTCRWSTSPTTPTAWPGSASTSTRSPAPASSTASPRTRRPRPPSGSAPRGHDVEAYTGGTEPERRLALEDELRGQPAQGPGRDVGAGHGVRQGRPRVLHPPRPAARRRSPTTNRSVVPAAPSIGPRSSPSPARSRTPPSGGGSSRSACRPSRRATRSSSSCPPTGPTSVPSLEAVVNLGRSRLQTLLKILEVDGAIVAVKGGFLLTDTGWRYDTDKAERLRALRRAESEQMLAFADRPGLPPAVPARDARRRRGRPTAAAATGAPARRTTSTLDPELVDEAARHLRAGDVGIEPRRQWPSGLDEPKGRIKPERAGPVGAGAVPGRRRWLGADDRRGPRRRSPAARRHDPGGRRRAQAVGLGRAADVDLPGPVTTTPRGRSTASPTGWGSSARSRSIAPSSAPSCPGGGFQADQANSAHQVANVWGHLAVDTSALPDGRMPAGPVLLVDDECDSRWTITVATHLLSEAGADAVLPLVLRTR